MIRSMTGYGRSELLTDTCRIAVEIKSVNNRYLDINIKMPRQLNQLEAQIRAELKKHIAAYAIPKEIVFRKELPKTLVGKVAYRKLEEEANSEEEAKS